jgi:tryptophan synthase alpha chain
VTKLLMPYITAGVRPDWATYLTAFSGAGADLIEVGLPFSDPTVDGLTIQEASDAALARGATPASVLAETASP